MKKNNNTEPCKNRKSPMPPEEVDTKLIECAVTAYNRSDNVDGRIRHFRSLFKNYSNYIYAPELIPIFRGDRENIAYRVRTARDNHKASKKEKNSTKESDNTIEKGKRVNRLKSILDSAVDIEEYDIAKFILQVISNIQ